MKSRGKQGGPPPKAKYSLATDSEPEMCIRDRRYTIVAALGLVPVYGLGMIQLAVVTDISLGAAFMGGVFPYLPLEAVKVLLAVRLVTALEKSGVLHR